MSLFPTITTEFNFTEEQKNFIEYTGKKSIILKSCAGSGKTRVCIERLKFLVKKGVDPKKIIFFSFTTAAVNELKNRIGNDDVKITTIHAFANSILSKAGKYKKPSSIYDFINWYKEKQKPNAKTKADDRMKYYEEISELFENAEYISAEISAYKLQSAEGIKTKLPDYFIKYCQFLKETKSRDFPDMLIETRNLLKENKWLRMFRNQYDYVLVDEFQDTAAIQLEILLSLNAPHYTLVGDRAQSIYGFQGSNCNAVEALLKRRRDVEEMALTYNFRSTKEIIEHSNKYSDLKAVAFRKETGSVCLDILSFDNFVKLYDTHSELVFLARTNAALREIEKRLLIKKIPIKYINYFNQREIKEISSGEIHSPTLKVKLHSVLPSWDNNINELMKFINDNINSKCFGTTIHGSKGREFDSVIVFNCISPEIIQRNGLNFTDEEKKYLSFDPLDVEDYEPQNVFYVAVSRARFHQFFSLINT